mgnify:CR=1 FL=1
MAVYTILMIENDYYTSKEFYGVYASANAVKRAIKDLVAKGEKIEINYRSEDSNASHQYEFRNDEHLIAVSNIVRIKKKYNKSSKDNNPYTIYVYKSEVVGDWIN